MAQVKNVSKVAQTLPTLGLSVDRGGVVEVPDEVADELAARPEFEAVPARKPAEGAKKEAN